MRKDLRVEKTLEAIDESFLKCICQFGFEQIKISNIIEIARINRTTFYRHYCNKYELRDSLLNKFLDDYKETLIKLFIKSNSINVNYNYTDLLILLNHFKENKYKYLALWTSDFGERNIFEEMQLSVFNEVLIVLNESDIENSNLFLSLHAKLFISYLMTHIRWWYFEGESVSLEDMAKIMFEPISEISPKTFLDNYFKAN